jgi:uncharacterized protein
MLQRLAMQGKPPQCVLVISVESVFFQCARALQRSKLWQAAPQSRPEGVPTPGAMLQALTASAIDGEQYDRELPARQKSTLY